MPTVDTQVAVVGAGPVGLLLAGELRLGGAEVLVLERLAEPTTESRASTVHARTMEILGQRGLLDALGDVPSDPRGHFGGLPLDFGDLPTAYPGQWKLAQARLEELLGKWAAGLGATILREHDVRGLVQQADGVQLDVSCPGGPLRVRARYVVGCDGEDSTVRGTAGFDFAGSDATRVILRGDVTGVEIRNRRFERHPGGLAVAGTLPSGVTRVMVHEPGTARYCGEPSFAELAAAWARVTGEHISGGKSLWVNAFGDGRRQASEYRRGRVLLAGDAAHLLMPAGGQALNLGLHDAMNLGWKLAACLRGDTPAGLLDSYHAERHPVAARALASVGAQALLLLGGPDVDPMREVLGEVLAVPAARRHLTGRISGVDVRYDLGGDHPLVGARLPPDGLAELLHDGMGVLLDSTSDGLVEDTARPWAGRVRAVRVTAPRPGFEPGSAVLARPDGHVAWLGRDGRGLRTALSRWFGLPR